MGQAPYASAVSAKPIAAVRRAERLFATAVSAKEGREGERRGERGRSRARAPLSSEPPHLAVVGSAEGWGATLNPLVWHGVRGL